MPNDKNNLPTASFSKIARGVLLSFWTRCVAAAALALEVPESPMALRWPLRILALTALISALVVLPMEIDRAHALFRNWFAPLWRRCSCWVSIHARWLRWIKLISALALITACVSACSHGGRHGHRLLANKRNRFRERLHPPRTFCCSYHLQPGEKPYFLQRCQFPYA